MGGGCRRPQPPAVEELDQTFSATTRPEDRWRVGKVAQCVRIRGRVGAQRLEERVGCRRARTVGLEPVDVIHHGPTPLSWHERVDQLVGRQREQVRDPLSRPLQEPFDPRRERRDHVAAAKAGVTRGDARWRRGAATATSLRVAALDARLSLAAHAARPAIAPTR
jgi:hypothetical protein